MIQVMEKILIQQLALDYNCSVAEVECSENVFTLRKNLPGRRVFRSDDAILKVCSFRDKLLISADECLLDWCRETYQSERAAWFSLFPNLKKLDDKLREFGHTVADCHHFYLPEREKYLLRSVGRASSGSQPGLVGQAVTQAETASSKFRIVWYEEDELERFRGDKRFQNALSTSTSLSPDMLAVTAEREGEILGMAGVSADSEMMWQIGIDVTEAGRGLGIGTILTTLLKDEVIRRGKVPFYGTAETHMKSQRVAVRSGFVPTWAELYSKKIKKKR